MAKTHEAHLLKWKNLIEQSPANSFDSELVTTNLDSTINGSLLLTENTPVNPSYRNRQILIE